MAEPQEMKGKFFEWSNEVLGKSPFDPKITTLLSMAVAMALGNEGAVSYFYFSAKKAGATEAELMGTADIVAATTGLNLYTLLPKE